MKTKHCIAFAALAVAALSGCAGQKEAKVSTGINLANLPHCPDVQARRKQR